MYNLHSLAESPQMSSSDRPRLKRVLAELVVDPLLALPRMSCVHFAEWSPESRAASCTTVAQVAGEGGVGGSLIWR